MGERREGLWKTLSRSKNVVKEIKSVRMEKTAEFSAQV